jgi:hypothetical protein
VCDYQIEVNLISYNNSARRLQNGQCCDTKTNSTMQAAAPCLGQDTCDVRFKFSAENYTTKMKIRNQSVIIGPYQDSDVITFDRCCTLMDGTRNPLIFIIPSSNWRNGVRCHVAIANNISVYNIEKVEIIGPSFWPWE